LDLGAREKTSLLETARQETHRLKHLVSNLLDLTRLESGPNLKLTTCDPIDLIGSALSPLELVSPNREIKVNVDPDAPPVRVDFVLIVQALINLIENALKYSDGVVWIGFCSTKDESVFEIGDEGPGIPEEDRERVFEKFFRLGDTDKVGSGLGLAISKGLVEAHGGTLKALARTGGGALLKLTLPKRPDEL
jgi:two-component system sensor histidine kinase KdpD